MAAAKPIFTKDTFEFFKDLKKNNRKDWMDANRERYQEVVVRPFRQLLEQTAQPVLKMDGRFEASGRGGANFSRINRDIRFAKDKTPYRPQMYLKFSAKAKGGRENGELYMGISPDAVTVGFRIYSGAKRKESALAVIAEPRVAKNPQWVAQQKKKLGRKYESYWYMTEKGEGRKREGWPTKTDDWKRMNGWIVRSALQPSAATKATFPAVICKKFREVYPLLKFTSLDD